MPKSIKLGKLLREDSAAASSLRELAAALGVSYEVHDTKGRRLLGDGAGDDATRFPIVVGDVELGVLLGPPGAAPLASLLRTWIAEEARRKAMANEVLTAYREINLLYKLSDQLAGTLKSQRQVAVALEEATRVIRGSWGAALLLEQDEKKPRVAGSFGEQTSADEQLTHTLWQVVSERQKPEIVNDLHADERFSGATGSAVRALLWAPLSTKRRLLGLLAIGSNRPGQEYAAADLSLLTTIASQVAPALENASLYENLERLVEERTRELFEAKELAEAGSLAKSRFLANMSHELRTPLNALLGYAQLLRRGGDLSDKQRQGLDVIARSGEHLLTLINDLLDLSKIEAGKLELESEALALRELVGDLAETFRLRAQERGIAFEHQVDAEVPGAVRGDARKLRQVLINLLSNAIKYTDEGTVTFRVRAQDGAIRFEVEDSGIGIAPEDQEQVFQAFRQVVRRGRVHQGTGLGLAISQQLVRAMGGDLSMRSAPGAGSTFWFSLQLEVCETQASALPSSDVVGFEGGPYRVLVVDDDEQSRAFVSELLLPLGFEVQQAPDGRAGVEKALAWRPHAIFMDLVMPELGGHEAIGAVRGAGLDDTVIIVLSASVFPSDREESVAAGANDFVAKPIRADELLEKLGRHLGVRWRRGESGGGLRSVGTGIGVAIDLGAGESASDALPEVLPPPDAMRGLYDAARAGRIAGVREQLDALEALDARFGPFVDGLRPLARRFELDAISAKLEPLLEQ
ncbi:MAG: response regulator [Myxococcales bacterium]|nr:response regulator [Myxococcales bacterium]